MRFRRKMSIVDAVQFFDEAAPPAGVRWSDSLGHYVTTMQGRHVPVSVGEWIVAEPDGTHHYPVADVEFRRIYESAKCGHSQEIPSLR